MEEERWTENMKALRHYYALTQKELAGILRVSLSTYRRYETGQSVHGVEALAKLSGLYRITMEEMLHGDFSSLDTAGMTKRERRMLFYFRLIRLEDQDGIIEVFRGLVV